MYDDSFRRRALAELETRPIGAVARNFGVNRATLRSWVARPVALIPNNCCRCSGASPSAASAYSALLGFYLGDGCISAFRDTKVTLRVSCDAAYPNIIKDVTDQLVALQPRGRVVHVRAPGVVVVQAMWKHWTCLFPQHGPGRKHDRRILLEPWQQEIVLAFPDDIRQLCCDTLELRHIPWRQSNWKTISVSTRDGVARLDELIGLKA